jgi:hypothetical protein
MVCAKHTIGSVTVLDGPECTEVTRHKWNLVSVCLEIVLILKQDRCIVYAERTIGSVIVLDAPNGLRGDEAQVEPRFGLSCG